MMMLKCIGLALLWLVPYLVSGFSAPFIFKHAPSPQVGGHYAGTLFFLAGVWSIYLSKRFNMPSTVIVTFALVLGLQILFWSWRFFNAIPLKESHFLGLSGSLWHGVLTSFYLLVACLLFIFLLKDFCASSPHQT